MKTTRLLSYLFFALQIFSGTALAQAMSCKVIGVSDGDTLKALCDNKKQLKVRLSNIDAPEKKQAFGEKSKQSLADLCFSKRAKIEASNTDRYGRTLGVVWCDEVNANREQVKRGMAWVYTQYNTDNSLPSLEKQARTNQIGLWAESNPSPPWIFRRTR